MISCESIVSAMNQSSLTTRLGEYISLILPDAHGHQQKAVCDFVFALLSVRTCCQAALARFFDNFEAASKRLSRLLHNERLVTEELALAHARARSRGVCQWKAVCASHSTGRLRTLSICWSLP